MPPNSTASSSALNGKESKKQDANGTTTPTPTRKRKRSSPFRIKVGCVVALRFRPELSNSPVSVVGDMTQQQQPSSSISDGSGAAEETATVAATATTRTHSITWDDNWAFVWTNPLPGRDEGLALIGKRIRCFFPKDIAANASSGQGENATPPRRVLEGEIIRMVDHHGVQPTSAAGTTTSKKHVPRSMQVELLVDEAQYRHFSYLPRSDLDDVPGDGASEKAKRNYRLEERIRGKNKVCVVVRLMKPWWMESRSEIGIKSGKALRWVIQKLVPVKLFHGLRQQQQQSLAKAPPAGSPDAGVSATSAASNGGATSAKPPPAATPGEKTAAKSSATATSGEGENSGSKKRKSNGKESNSGNKRRKTQSAISKNARHVGDGNDSAEQQMSNWRWLASRFHDTLLSAQNSELDAFSAEALSGGFVAEVLNVESMPSNGSSTSTLAVVTLRKMYLPEQTASGRLSRHHGVSIFNDHDSIESSNSNEGLRLKVPIEHLVVVSRKVEQVSVKFNMESLPPIGDDVVPALIASHHYSLQGDAYHPAKKKEKTRSCEDGNGNLLPASTTKASSNYCHRCRRMLDQRIEKSDFGVHRLGDDDADDPWLCPACKRTVHFVHGAAGGQNESTDDQTGDVPCDCKDCRQARSHFDDGSLELFEPGVEAADSESLFGATNGALDSAPIVDFGLPLDFCAPGSWPTTAAKPISRVKTVAAKKDLRSTKKATKRRVGEGKNGEKKGAQSASKVKPGVPVETPKRKPPGEDYSVFKPTCARLLAYDPRKKYLSAGGEALGSLSNDKPRNLRETMVVTLITETERDEKAMSGRAARANQRRMMKDVASFSATTSLAVDTLASREPQLRFDRSGIHAWGVFADEDIAAGEMIVEYRGVLIGNTIAEKLEKEYEAAKIGSDYMFRVDTFNVCDATKQGNVARFINASCDPNCYTKIITLDGNKRIVIYAKRDIRAGEELCYDYKFPLEYDESKRIPCHCGAKECRGYMNWDKRYVALADDASNGGDGTESPTATRADAPALGSPSTTNVGLQQAGSCAQKGRGATDE